MELKEIELKKIDLKEILLELELIKRNCNELEQELGLTPVLPNSHHQLTCSIHATAAAFLHEKTTRPVSVESSH